MSKYVIDNDTLIAIGDAIRTVEETTDSIPVVDIPDRILALEKPGANEMILSGNLSYALTSNCWEDKLLKKIQTQDITDAFHLFDGNSSITTIPFDLNFKSSSSYHNMNYMFKECSKLEKLPMVYNAKPRTIDDIFYGCRKLTKEEMTTFLNSLDYSYMENNKTYYEHRFSEFFYACYSLRAPAPMFVFRYDNPAKTSTSDTMYNMTFYCCYALDEITDLPIVYTSTLTSNHFKQTFDSCYRLKNLTFEMNADGTPKVVNWQSQVISLTQNVGYASTYSDSSNPLLINKSGITKDKYVGDDATYAALKNDPDWYTDRMYYSRYNHDSAVATINSLPDTSAYLATQTNAKNNINFKGSAGLYTDGGAINTLTEEEIAVAAAKGWTVGLT